MTFDGNYVDEGRSVRQTHNGGYILAGYTDSFGAGGYDFYLIHVAAETPILTLTPDSTTIIIPSGGGSFTFELEIINGTTANYIIDVSTDVTMPNGSIYPLLSRDGINLISGMTITRNLTQFVPPAAPAGNYIYNGYIYDHNTGELLAEDCFPFTKLPGDNSNFPYQSWEVEGWDEEEPVVIATPSGFVLYSAYPNPFNHSTVISFDLRDASFVELMVYDIQGREVARLVEGFQPAGVYERTFDGFELSSGIYFARFQAGDFHQVQKLLLVK